MAKNTGRRPNVHTLLSKWIERGFADELIAAIERVRETGEDELFSLYMPQPHQQAWARLSNERVPPEVVEKLKGDIDENPIEWTIRKNDEERTLIATMANEAGTCPPRCT